jgi:HK97 family phage prohead protease
MDIATVKSNLPRREHRLIEGAAELRAAADGKPRIAMHIPYDRRSETMWGFVEIIKPSAFTKTLQERGSDVVSLWNHDPLWVLGRESNRTLDIRNSDQELEGVVTLDADDPMHKHFARRVERRDVKGSSFGFETVRDNYITEADGTILRELVEVRLYDLSPVTFPAYPDSDAEKRGHAEALYDVASARAKVDLAALAAAIVRMEQGRFAAADVAEMRAWLAFLEHGVPAPAATVTPIAVLRRQLDLRARRLGLSPAA